MKKIIISLLLISLMIVPQEANAGAAFFENNTSTRYVSVIIDEGSGNSYHRLSNWSSQNFGTITSSSTFKLDGGLAHVWRDNSSNITGVSVKYRVYKQGTSAPSYSSFSIGWAANLAGNDQRWEGTGNAVDLKTGVNSTGTWVLDIYFEGATNGVNCSNPILWGSPGTPYSATFTAGSGLPVTLIDFSSSLNKQSQAELSWSTASELNASHFSIHRSSNGVDKREVGIVAAQGNSNEIVEYNFIDAEPISISAFYFLEQVDFDGKIQWYGPVKAVSAQQTNIQAFFKENNQLQINTNSTIYTRAKLMSLDGKVVASIEVSQDIEIVTVPDIKNGMYLLEVSNATHSTVVKLMK